MGTYLGSPYGMSFWIFEGGVGEDGLASVRGLDGAFGDGPVAGVGNGSGCVCFDIEVIEAEAVERGVGIGGHIERVFCACGLDVPDVHVAEVRQSLFTRHPGAEGDPVGRNVVHPFGHDGVAEAGVPVHGDVNGNGDSLEGEVVDADVFCESAAHAGGLEQDAGRDAAEGGDVVGLDVAKPARGLAADGDSRRAMAHDAVAYDNVLGGTIDAQAV